MAVLLTTQIRVWGRGFASGWLCQVSASLNRCLSLQSPKTNAWSRIKCSANFSVRVNEIRKVPVWLLSTFSGDNLGKFVQFVGWPTFVGFNYNLYKYYAAAIHTFSLAPAAGAAVRKWGEEISGKPNTDGKQSEHHHVSEPTWEIYLYSWQEQWYNTAWDLR